MVATTVATTTTLAGVPAEPEGDPAPPAAGGGPSAAERGVAVIPAGGAGLAAAPGGAPFVVAHEGLVFPVLGRSGEWLRLLTGCEDEAWVEAASVAFTPQREPLDAGPGFDLGDAVAVLDPGHGGANQGAPAADGAFFEKEVNLDIARRTRDLMAEPRRIDPASGRVLPGTDIAAFGTVWVTRTEGPPGADYEAGLKFRTELADMAGADAFVSIHNNAEPDGPFDGPGSEVFYRFTDPASKRLAGLLIEELRRSFAPFDAAWMGDTDAGAKYRVRDDGVTDYYGVLRQADVPAVLAEGAFVSNPEEAALLATPEFRHAYAEAIYRALVRFLTTDDPGSGYTEPYPRTAPAGSGAPRPGCVVPQQPGS